MHEDQGKPFTIEEAYEVAKKIVVDLARGVRSPLSRQYTRLLDAYEKLAGITTPPEVLRDIEAAFVTELESFTEGTMAASVLVLSFRDKPETCGALFMGGNHRIHLCSNPPGCSAHRCVSCKVEAYKPVTFFEAFGGQPRDARAAGRFYVYETEPEPLRLAASRSNIVGTRVPITMGQDGPQVGEADVQVTDDGITMTGRITDSSAAQMINPAGQGHYSIATPDGSEA